MRLNLPVELIGIEIQRKIWSELMPIPSGQVRICEELENRLHFLPKVTIQAGEANPPIPYIPGHYVIAVSSSNAPLAEGNPAQPFIQTKHGLLKHEGNHV